MSPRKPVCRRVTMPGDMLELIEEYARVSPRLYRSPTTSKPTRSRRLAVRLRRRGGDVQATDHLSVELPEHRRQLSGACCGMGGGAHAGQQARRPAARAGFNAAAAAEIVPERDGPIVFAKSPRSCIIATGEPFYIPEGNQRIDWEGELGIIIGKPAFNVPRERAHDYIFGYSIVNDISDRGGRQRRVVSMFPGANWFDGKSIDRGGPFGPYIVPKEFIKADESSLVTRVNGVVKQDAARRT